MTMHVVVMPQNHVIHDVLNKLIQLACVFSEERRGGSGYIMEQRPRSRCSYAGCRDLAGDGCLRDDKRCCRHCDCKGHDRRQDRPGGQRRGQRGAASRMWRTEAQEQYKTNTEIIWWLEDHDAGELEAAGMTTHSACRRALTEEALTVARNGAGSVSDDGSPMSILLASIPASMVSRLLQDVKLSLRRRREPVLEFEATIPNPVTAATNRSSTSAYIAPPPPPGLQTGGSSSSSHYAKLLSPPPLPSAAPFVRLRPQALTPGPYTGQHRKSGLPLADISPELRLEDLTDRVADECRRGFMNLRVEPPWRGEVPQELAFLPRGAWPWNDVKNHVTAHRNRVSGPDRVIRLQRGKYTSMASAAMEGCCLGRESLPTASDEVTVLRQWMAARPGFADRVVNISVPEHPPWEVNGMWLQVDLNHTPPPPVPGCKQRTGFHGTSMAALYRCVLQGPQEGWDGIMHEGEPRLGIYMHCWPRQDLAGGYMVHTPLRRSGWIWAPVLELDWPCPDPHGRPYIGRSSGDTTQYLTYADVVRMPRFYLQLSHMSMWTKGARQEWIDTEPRFPSECEVDPHQTAENLVNLARQRFLSEVAAAGSARPRSS